jgi:hypothetical protein
LNPDTDLGGPAANFPATHCSLVRAAGSPDPVVRRQAQDILIAAYWKPVYKYIRVRWKSDNEIAKDLTQAFFAAALEQGFFDRFDPAKAKFRTFVRLCVDGVVAKDRRAFASIKRGGDIEVFPLDYSAVEAELARQKHAANFDPDDYFRQEWVRGLFAAAVDELRQRCAAVGKEQPFKLFERYDLEGPDAIEKPTYANLAQEFDLPETQVTNYLAFARRLFRQLALERLRAATATEEEYQYEVVRLFGGDVR